MTCVFFRVYWHFTAKSRCKHDVLWMVSGWWSEAPFEISRPWSRWVCIIDDYNIMDDVGGRSSKPTQNPYERLFGDMSLGLDKSRLTMTYRGYRRHEVFEFRAGTSIIAPKSNVPFCLDHHWDNSTVTASPIRWDECWVLRGSEVCNGRCSDSNLENKHHIYQ